MKKFRMSLTISIASFFLLSSFTYAEMLTVNADKVNLRGGPGTKYPVSWEYGVGFPVEVVKKNGNWVNVRDFENEEGWIYKSLLSKQPQVIVIANKNTDGKVNIREQPSIKSNIVGKAYYGVVFKKVKTESGWVKVEHETGLSGWIKRNLLWGY